MVEGEELDPNLTSLFFSFCFYHVFIVFGYKKLCAALAMEKTTPINPKQNTKETVFPIPLQI